MSHEELAATVHALTSSSPDRPTVGGFGQAALSHGTSATVRHSLNGFLGEAHEAPQAQKIAMGVASLFLGGMRVGLSYAKKAAGTELVAASTEGAFFGVTERLVQSLLGSAPKKNEVQVNMQ